MDRYTTLKYVGNKLEINISWKYYLISILLSSRILDFVRLPAAYYYIIIILILVRHILTNEKLKILNYETLLFVTVAFLSLWLNEIDPFFRSYERYGSFLLNLAVFGPIIYSKSLIKLRLVLLEGLCQVFVSITVFSFAGLICGFLPLAGIGGFQGITVHAMTLSALAGISILYLVFKYSTDSKSILFKRAVLALILICCFVLLISASRAALAGTILSCLILLYKINRGKLLNVMKVALITVLLVLLSFPIWSEYSERITHKFNASLEKDNIFSSRENLWEARIKEFKTSPIYGIGFGNLLAEYNDYGINEETGGIETGSSWGMVLSMTGIIGFTLFLLLNFKSINQLLKINGIISPSLVVALLTFFIIHMVFEGYVFASGNILMIFFWLLLSVSDYYYLVSRNSKI